MRLVFLACLYILVRMPRSAASISTELASIDAAIEKICTGAQSYSTSGQSVMRANLDTLFKRRDELQAMLDSVNGDAPMFPEASISGLGEGDPIDEE
jgi:hypothetical protein